MSLRSRLRPARDSPTCLLAAATILLAACGPTAAPGTPGPEVAPASIADKPLLPTIGRLPTGASLDPAGTSVDVGSLPLAMEVSPDGRYVPLLLNGWREQGVQVVERAAGRATKMAEQPAACLGLAFSPDGRRMYVAENLGDALAVVDLESGDVIARHDTERYPYGVAVAPDGTVFVSAWGGNTVSAFRFAEDGSTILDMGLLSQFDYSGRPLRGTWAAEADLTPYSVLTPSVPLDELNPEGEDAEASEELDLRFEDIGQDDLFNQILWRIIKGSEVPYPGTSRMSALEWKRGR